MLKSVLSDINIAPTFLFVMICLELLFPSAHVQSTHLSNWVSCRQHIDGSCFCFLIDVIFLIHLVTLCLSFFFFFIYFISWRLITSKHCSGFCHTLTWVSHGVTCILHPERPSHLCLHPIPLGLPSAPGPSTCLMHPTWAGDLFHYR